MRARRLAGVTLVAAWLALPTAAHAVDITSPPHQSGVTEGRTVTVSGGDCPAGAPVRVFFTAAPQRDASTTAAPDGSWSVGLLVPRLDVADVEEASEQSIVAECAGQRDSVVVAYDQARSGRAELPYTGSVPTTALAAVGALLVVLGAGADRAGRRGVRTRRRLAGGPRGHR